ncbi:multiple C2 and transmembrane domain-containing protein isoform X24 [Macrobrachium rosenbergii]|uniref:multiple C2 and transmembrane domain-containing protein isoform X24 n=1 Tax=Macrobrachium rosenbergii TaxID=79674 RepID=UPI0034D53721
MMTECSGSVEDSMKQETLHVTVSDPVGNVKKDPISPDHRSGAPLTFHKVGTVGGSLAKAFRKVFRSRTPSPSTEDKEDDHFHHGDDLLKCDVSSGDFEFHDGVQAFSSPPGTGDSFSSQIFAYDATSVVTSYDEVHNASPLSRDRLHPHSPNVAKSQTYSALSEALHHAFLEGMVCSGADDVNLMSNDDLHIQGSKSENDVGHSKGRDFGVNSRASHLPSDEGDNLKREESEFSSHSLLVPSLSNRSGPYSDHSDAGTEDEEEEEEEESSSQHSRDERQHQQQQQQQESHSPPEHDHNKSFDLFGNFFSHSRRSSMLPQTNSEESKTDGSKPEVYNIHHPSPHHKSLKDKESGRDHVKGHKSLGDTLSKVAVYLQRGGSRLAEQQRRLKSQIWSSVVTIVLVEGKNMLPMDPDGTSDPYVKFRLGNEKYKSKVELHTLTPRWLEQFDLHLFEDQSQMLEITVWDKDLRKDDFIGKCSIDLTQYERERTHHIWVDLDKGAGSLFLLLTISGTTSSETISDLHSYQENPKEIRTVADRYKVSRTLHNLRDIGHLRVKVYRAQGLAAADLGGKSDPFCVLELINARLQTQTEYKTLSPTWNKIFTFNVKDIHSILEVTVYDEDRDHKVEFLGKVAVPLLKVKNGEKRWYALKDKKLRLRAKGSNPEILLECSVEWNPIRAALRTFTPMEEKYMQVEQKFKRQVFIRNVNRLKSSIMDFYELGKFIKSCWEWESPFRSIVAFIIFMVGTYCFEVYMLPIMLLCLFLRNYIVISIVGSMMHREDESELSADEEEVDDDDKDKEEKKTLKERLQVIQEVTLTVQNAIGYIASLCESCKNTFNFSVPFLSWLLILVLIVGTVVLYFIPVRYLVMMWGVNKFSRKLFRPHSMVNNEVLDFLSRVPDDETLRDCRELRPVPHSEEKRRDQRKKKLN